MAKRKIETKKRYTFGEGIFVGIIVGIGILWAFEDYYRKTTARAQLKASTARTRTARTLTPVRPLTPVRAAFTPV